MGTIRSKPFLATGIAVVALVLAGCGSEDDDSASDGDVAGRNVIVSSCASSNPFCGVLNDVLVRDLEAAGVNVRLLENNLDPTAQVQQLNQAIAQRPDAIVALLTDTTSSIPAIRKASQAGIPVVNIDGRADPEALPDIALQVLTANDQLGKFAAMNIVEGLRKEGREGGNVIAITGTQSSLSVQDRMKGFKTELAKTPEYKLVAEEDAQWNPVTSGELASQLFAQYRAKGGIQAAYGMADYMAVPIIQAAKQAGLAVGGDNGIVVTGSNCTKAGIEAVRAGELYGSGTQSPDRLGAAAAEHTLDLLKGVDQPETIVLPEQRITDKNVEKHAEACSDV